MRKVSIISIVLVVVAAGLSAHAQETPKVEIAVGYSSTESFGDSCKGAGGSVAFNRNRWLGVAAEVDACRSSATTGFLGGTLATPIDRTVLTYLFGPRFSFRSERRLTPFAQILFGGAHGTTSLSAPLGLRGNVFAMSAGPGLDIRLAKPVALRLQPEYLRTHFAEYHQNQLRVRAGIVFRLGGSQ